jgi:hypothetical protein
MEEFHRVCDLKFVSGLWYAWHMQFVWSDTRQYLLHTKCEICFKLGPEIGEFVRKLKLCETGYTYLCEIDPWQLNYFALALQRRYPEFWVCWDWVRCFLWNHYPTHLIEVIWASNLDMVLPVVCWNNSNTVESVKHNTCIILRCDMGWLHVSTL